jgi:ribosomal protein S21
MKNSKYSERKTYNKPLKGGELVGSSKVETQAHEPVQAEPLEVKVFGNFDKAMRVFRTLVQKERILSLYKEKQSFEKPSDKKRRKRNEMKRKLLEIEMKEENPRFKKREREESAE